MIADLDDLDMTAVRIDEDDAPVHQPDAEQHGSADGDYGDDASASFQSDGSEPAPQGEPAWE